LKLNRVVFNKPEAEWLTRNIIRTKQILEASSQKDPKVLERVTYKTLKAISESTQHRPLEDGSHEFILTRKQKQIVSSLVFQTLMVLTEKIIPEYTRRGLTEYLNDAKIKASILKGMCHKLK
jgi:hypothetical protein